jgi:AraC-like DNA-binding protein
MTLDTNAYRRELREAVQTMLQLREYSQALAQQVYGPVGRHSMRHVAREVGLSPTYLCNVLAGHQGFSPDAYERIASWFFSQERP